MIARSLAILQHYGLLDAESGIKRVEIMILCPLHQEDTPSCGIDLERELFYCQGCRRGGTLIDLVAALEQVNQLQALAVISRIEAGLQQHTELVAKFTLVARERQDIDPRLARRQARDFFFTLPPTDWSEIESHYLLDRGFERRTLQRFDVRINQSSDFPIIFPIRENGRFVGYMTRALDNRPGKYRHSLGLPKSEIVCGTVRNGSIGLVVEGFLDCARAIQNGWRDTVSTLNCYASDVQLEKLARFGAVICGLDNDDAGERGYRLLREKLPIPVVRYPFPSWIKDHGEMSEHECRAGINIALRRLNVAA